MLFIGTVMPNRNKHISFRIENVGDRPLTLTSITGHHWKSRWRKLLKQKPQTSFVVPTVNVSGLSNLPQKMEIGELWQGFIDQEADVEKMLMEYVQFEAHHTLSKKSVKRHVKLTPPKPDHPATS